MTEVDANPADPARADLARRFLEKYDLTPLAPGDLDLALTHRSYAYEAGLQEDNERLEFLGDSLITAVTSEFLYSTQPQADEGALSKRRSNLISRQTLGRRAVELGLGELILLGRGERTSGGTRRRSTLGSALESLVGVLYLRLGFDAARQFVRGHILEPLAHCAPSDAAQGDYKSALQEWAQQNLKTVPVYRRLAEEGPEHAKHFLVQVEVAGRVIAQAAGGRIKIAENEAARAALEKILAGEETF